MHRIVIFLSVLILASCVNTRKVDSFKEYLTQDQKNTWSSYIGTWYNSEPTNEGGVKENISEFFPNGTFKFKFRIYDVEGNFEDSVEVGLWGVSGNIQFTIFRGWVNDSEFQPSDPSDPYNYDAYEILELTETTIKYKSVSSDNIFTSTKVPDGYQFKERRITKY